MSPVTIMADNDDIRSYFAPVSGVTKQAKFREFFFSVV